MNAPPNVSLTPSRDAAIRRGLVGPLDETLECITRRSRCNSVHCGACHRLSPIGSFKCGFCKFQFLAARNPIRRVPDVVDRGHDRDMQRSHSRGAEPKRGHNRSASGDEHKRMVKLQKHTHRWDTDTEYRMQRSRQGMIRTQYNTHVVAPWMALNAKDTPPDLPQLPLGIPAVANFAVKFSGPRTTVRGLLYFLHQTSDIFGALIGHNKSGACRFAWSTSFPTRSF